MERFIPRKKIRLPADLYQGQRAYSITICTSNSLEHFKNPDIVKFAAGIMKDVLTECGIAIYAYCFMPDHLHILLGSDERSDVVQCIRKFKQLTGYHVKRQFGFTLWQKSFYDHILRKEENIREVARYILENPVRKGLVDDFREYPFLGSTVIDCSGGI